MKYFVVCEEGTGKYPLNLKLPFVRLLSSAVTVSLKSGNYVIVIKYTPTLLTGHLQA